MRGVAPEYRTISGRYSGSKVVVLRNHCSYTASFIVRDPRRQVFVAGVEEKAALHTTGHAHALQYRFKSIR